MHLHEKMPQDTFLDKISYAKEYFLEQVAELEFIRQMEQQSNYVPADLKKAQQLVPEIYWEFLSQFSKQESE